MIKSGSLVIWPIVISGWLATPVIRARCPPIRTTRRNWLGSACGQKRSGPGSAGLNTTRRAQQHEDHINVLAMAVFVVVTISAARHAGQSSPPSPLRQISLLLRQYLAPNARCAQFVFAARPAQPAISNRLIAD